MAYAHFIPYGTVPTGTSCNRATDGALFYRTHSHRPEICHKKSARKGRFLKLATPARFERATHSLEGCCSIQLSYGARPIFFLHQFFLFVKTFLSCFSDFFPLHLLYSYFSRNKDVVVHCFFLWIFNSLHQQTVRKIRSFRSGKSADLPVLFFALCHK